MISHFLFQINNFSVTVGSTDCIGCSHHLYPSNCSSRRKGC